jgi:hypothetical protein
VTVSVALAKPVASRAKTNTPSRAIVNLIN